MSVRNALRELRQRIDALEEKYSIDTPPTVVTLTRTGQLDGSSTLTWTLPASEEYEELRGYADSAVAGDKASERGFNTSGDLSSADLLLESLLECTAVTLRTVAKIMDIPLRGAILICKGEVHLGGVRGILNAEGDTVPVIFKNVRLIAGIECDEGHQDRIPRLVELTERYCFVLQTFRNGTNVNLAISSIDSMSQEPTPGAGVGDS